jgi:hypothetical protein
MRLFLNTEFTIEQRGETATLQIETEIEGQDKADYIEINLIPAM